MVRPSGALALLALLVCAGCKGRSSGTEEGDKPDLVVLVRTARVERQTVGELVEAAATDVVEAEAAHTGGLQALGPARAGDQVAQIHERRSVVRSPVQGTVLHRLVAPGQYVQPDTILFSVAPMAHLDLSAVVPASELARLRVGQEGELDCPGPDAASPRGEVKLVAPALDPASGTATVRVAITNEARTLRPGMFCRVRLVADRHDSTLVVPVSAVTFKEAEQKGTVAVVDGDVAR